MANASETPGPPQPAKRRWPDLVLLLLLSAVAAVGGWSIWRAYSNEPGLPEGYVADVPNVDWKGLDRSGRKRATQVMNQTPCVCGCGMTVARCRRDDPTCPRSPGMAANIIAAVKEGKGDADVAQAASSPVRNPADDSTVARVKLDLDGAMTIGPEKAPITLVEFIDYQCPFCDRAQATVEELQEKYGEKLRLAVRQYPLAEIHPEAYLAAQAALAAGEQGKFYEMHRLMLSNRDLLMRDHLLDYARELGLDVAAFEAALDSGRFAERVNADLEQVTRLGVTGTPYFFINGRPVMGARPVEEFVRIIEEELSGRLKPTRWLERVPSEIP
jgi:protein-disulfide isomerase